MRNEPREQCARKTEECPTVHKQVVQKLSPDETVYGVQVDSDRGVNAEHEIPTECVVRVKTNCKLSRVIKSDVELALPAARAINHASALRINRLLILLYSNLI